MSSRVRQQYLSQPNVAGGEDDDRFTVCLPAAAAARGVPVIFSSAL